MLPLAANTGIKHDKLIAPKHGDVACAFRTTLYGNAQTVAGVAGKLADPYLMCFQEAVCG